jgi:hypothetical protein
MSEQNGSPQSADVDPVLKANLARADHAARQLDAINKTMPPGLGVSVPDWADLAATINVIAELLIDSGAIAPLDFVRAKTDKLAEIYENCVAQAREIRQRTGLVIPGQPQPG